MAIEPEWEPGNTDPVIGNTQVIESGQGLQVLDQARAAKTITSNEEYVALAEFLKMIKAGEASVDETFDKIIKKAHEAHKESLAEKKKHREPWEQAESIVKGLLGGWERHQELVARQEAEALRAKMQQDVEQTAADDRLKRAEELHMQGRTDEALAIIDGPAPQIDLSGVPVKVESNLPKVSGLSHRKTYKAEVQNLRALVASVAAGTAPIECLEANMTFLNAQARAYKKEGDLYAGVKSVQERGTASGSK